MVKYIKYIFYKKEEIISRLTHKMIFIVHVTTNTLPDGSNVCKGDSMLDRDKTITNI